jgi:hypothetical protein
MYRKKHTDIIPIKLRFNYILYSCLIESVTRKNIINLFNFFLKPLQMHRQIDGFSIVYLFFQSLLHHFNEFP